MPSLIWVFVGHASFYWCCAADHLYSVCIFQFPDIIELNVGGSHYTTTLLTLTKGQDNMLSAMFSGNYTAVCDKDGRYFIDADGANFKYVLNYLRYGELPQPNIAETVYREAVYFGIQELVQELEKYPSILSKIQRNNFRNSFPGYQECMDTIVNMITQKQVKSIETEIIVLLYRKEKNKATGPHPDEYNYNHICYYTSIFKPQKTLADAKLGPWKAKISERDMMNCFIFDLQSQGFVVTLGNRVDCCYATDERNQCHKQFYKLTFHWWKKID